MQAWYKALDGQENGKHLPMIMFALQPTIVLAQLSGSAAAVPQAAVWLLELPPHGANVERHFSMYNDIHTDARASLSMEKAAKLTIIKVG
jgi:hypothetical protein